MPGDQENKLYLTNNFSIISKYSAVKNKYFSDSILEDFVENWIRTKSWRRAPIVNRGYAARLLAMDWAMGRTIRCHNVGCAIVLGAGYDMLSLRRLHQTCWIEIDLPQVVQVKIEFIKAKHNLKSNDITQHNECIFSIVSLNYHLISCDICDTVVLRKHLDSTLELVNNNRNDIIIVNEVCLCYIETESIESILKSIVDSVRETACRVHYIGYEQINPGANNEYFGNLMLNHFSSIGHSLKHYPTTQEVIVFFKEKLSFQHVTVVGMYNTFHNVLTDQILDFRGFFEEPFDEFEEMDLYLGHYKLIMATLIIRDPSTGQETVSLQYDEDDFCENTERYLKLSHEINHNPITNVYITKSKNLQRFGHSSCMLNSETIIVTGGFGTPITFQNEATDSNRQHGRVSDCSLLRVGYDKSLEPEQIPLQKFPTDQIRLDRMHGQVSKIGDNSCQKLFFNGGRQSPKGVTSRNHSFVAAFDSNDGLVLVEKFCDKQHVPLWRHRQVPISSDCVLQIGGLSSDVDSFENCIKIWNFDSSKIGCRSAQVPRMTTMDTNNEPGAEIAFRRHSFGLDISKNGSTLFVWGGLQTLQKNYDKPVESSWSKLLWDMRSDTVSKVNVKKLVGINGSYSINCYGADIHFISDNQLLRIGGLDAASGLEFGWDKSVELFDLRNFQSFFVDLEAVIEDNYTRLFTLTNATSCKFDKANEIVTIGGGGNYFTFGTCFQENHLVYKYAI